MRFLTNRQRQTLAALCDTIKPGAGNVPLPDPFGHSAVDLGVPDLIEKALYERDDDRVRRRLRLLLNALDRRLFNGWMSGNWCSFADLSLDCRTEVLQSMARSRVEFLRAAFQDLKQIASFIAYSHYAPLADNPTWAEFGYPGQASNPRHSFQYLPTVNVDTVDVLDCEVLVVGSGAGGGVVAAELATAGYDVLIVEKGKQFGDHDLPQTELAGMRELYEGKGSFKTFDRSMVVLAGSTLGGGTTVNWMTCLRPPDRLRQQWATEYGFTAAATRDYSDAIDVVCKRIGVTTDESPANPQNAILERGCRTLGYDVSVIPRNVRGCVKCDFCAYGCRYGGKQDTRRTLLQDAVDHGARIVVRGMVDRITHARGRVTGAEMTVRDRNGRRRSVQVRCKAVISSAGAIHTPALLLRSGLTNRHLGNNLHLHPVGAVYARHGERIAAWEGPPQTRVSEEFADLDGQGYGFRLEVSPAHPGLWALGLPWFSGPEHRDLMREVPHLGNIIVLLRDRYAGRVKLDRAGRPALHYRLHPYDANHMVQGVEAALRVQHAAGAVEIFGPHQDRRTFQRGTKRAFEQFLGHVRGLGTRPHHFGMFCAHQLSTCRLAGAPSQGPLSPEGESYEVQNLYCADGSVLPTSTGVNPMITIMSTAYHIAQHVKANMARSMVHV